MKKIHIIIYSLLILSTSLLGQQSSYYHSQVFDEENYKEVEFVLANSEIDVEIEETRSSRLIISVIVTANVSNKKILGFLAEQKRYELSPVLDKQTGRLIIQEAKIKNQIFYKGKKVEEKIRYTIQIPKGKDCSITMNADYIKSQLK